MVLPLIDWAACPKVVEEWLPYIGEQALDAEAYQTISLLFAALADEEGAHANCEDAWECRNEQAPCAGFCAALDRLRNALHAWQRIHTWIGERLCYQESQELTKLQASSAAHCQRLRLLYRTLQGLIARSAKEYGELLQIAVLEEACRPVAVP